MSFSPVKALIDVTDRARWPREALIGLRLISPDDPACSGIDGEASLTDAAQAQDRIRFFLKDRLTRNFRDVGRAWLSAVGPCTVEVTHAELLDEGSRLFLETLAALPGPRSGGDVEVRLRVGGGTEVSAGAGTGAGEGTGGAVVVARPPKSPREETVDRLLARAGTLSESELDHLYEQAEEYLSVGDSWTAERILRGVQPHRDVPAVWGRLGLAYTMQGRTLEAEFCCLRWRDDPDPVGVAGADYALSMLYARHHPPHLRSLDRTAEYLEHGYAALDRVGEGDDRDLTFHRVFNRNGYALVEFRRGRVDAAMEHLTAGISKLRSGTAVHRMHQTVLIYNLAQCYRRIGRIDSAIETYRELLAVDGKMPEYHMELALCHLSAEQFHDALDSLLRARSLGPSIQEVHSLLGFTYMRMGRAAQALDSYRSAHECDPRDVEALYDYAYLLAESEQPERALRLACTLDTGRLPRDQAARLLTLTAEQHARLGNLPAAHSALEEVLALSPDDPDARANLDQVAAAMA